MDQASTLRNITSAPHTTKVIAVTSGKGGVGKTNIITNIAYLLAKSGNKVLLMDADLGLGNIDILLGLSPKFNISHLLKGEKTIDQIIVSGPGGIKIIPAASGIQKTTDINDYEKNILIEQLTNLQDNFDYFMIDTGAGIAKNVTYFCTAAQEIIVIATPEPTSITDAYALMKVLYKEYKEKRFNLIINNSKSKNESMQVFKTLSLVVDKYLGVDVSLNYLGYIPSDPNFPMAVKKQKLLLELQPNSPTYSSINDIVNKINNIDFKTNSKGNIQFFWNKIFNL